ncbi:MAG: DUF3737 family protein [Ruminococcaceae bacterium]|nr:DUF3737 family protein [Oscillospiraceae bacterium]
MKITEKQTFDSERALYGSFDLCVKDCRFEGERDGESALKESGNIVVENCFFDLRYPFWHDNVLSIKNTELSENCRAALWYSNNIKISSSKLHGIKALRECGNVEIETSDIVSSEFGWSVEGIKMTDTSAEGEYFMMRSSGLEFNRVELVGKYSFQYITDSVFENCVFNTKDAFWHAKNVTVRNSVVNGEYLGWYAENITFENCRISGTQPFCYCKGLKLIDCEMTGADLSFEKSDVEATLTSPVISIKNPRSGFIKLPFAEEIIIDDENAKYEIIETDKSEFCK